jgi:NTE family protein
MRQMHGGPIVAIDMSEARGVDPDLIENPPSIWRLIATGAWRRGPPIVSILMRSATLTTDADIESSRAATDILIQPTPDGLDIRDWKGFEVGVTAGYQATHEVLSLLDGPVTALRRRRSINDDAQPETAVQKAAASLRPGVLEKLRQGARRGRKEKPRA